MKERPIIFTPDNAQKCFEGKKTMTRRIVKERNPYLYVEPRYDERGAVVLAMDKNGDYHEHWPYGVVGDRLWCREKWADVNTESGPAFMYSSGALKFCQDDAFPIEYDRYPGSHFTMWCGDLMRGEPAHRWRPPLHMYRYACRTVVELTDVRVERLQEITQLDALHEGCDGPDHKANFYKLWQSIHGKGSWDANPFVWVLTFTSRY